MNKEKSIGIIVFGLGSILYYIIGILRLMGGLVSDPLIDPKIQLPYAVLLFITFIVGLIAAINTFRLKNWSRKLLIVITSFVIVLNVFLLIFNPNISRLTDKNIRENAEKLWGEYYDRHENDIKYKRGLSRDEYIEQATEFVNNKEKMQKFRQKQKAQNVVNSFFDFILGGALIAYFTRLKVKQQF